MWDQEGEDIDFVLANRYLRDGFTNSYLLQFTESEYE